VVRSLAAGRLGIEGPPQSVRQQARRLGVTRARVYQLLDDCSKVFDVRWPAGQLQLEELARKCADEIINSDRPPILEALRELLYPGKYGEVADTAYVA
jgi:hypothetical protein